MGTPFPPVEAQLRAIRRGAAGIISEGELAERLDLSRKSGAPLRVKLGVDPTAPDIHLGNAVPLWKLRQFQDLGHKAVLIIGDYTAMVGDPSGRNKTRPTLSKEEVDRHAETYLRQIGRILLLDDPGRFELRRNSEWLAPMSFSEVLRLAGRTSVARMLERDDFSLRHREGVPIQLHEFLYPLMQGWDSVVVRSDVELGGTDQTFNNLVGRDLQRGEGQEPQVVITTPLLEGTDGSKKMSKSLGNTIGIAEPPEEIYGKAMSIPDGLTGKYMALATDLPEEEIARLLAPGAHPRDAKAALAFAIARRYHGEEGARRGAAHFDRVFRGKEAPEEIPLVRVPAGASTLAKVLVAAGVAGSGREARRLVEQGGVAVDGERAADADAALDLSRERRIQAGKRRFVRVIAGP